MPPPWPPPKPHFDMKPEKQQPFDWPQAGWAHGAGAHWVWWPQPIEWPPPKPHFERKLQPWLAPQAGWAQPLL